MAERQLTNAGKGCILVVFLGAVLLMVGGALLAVPGLYWAGRPEPEPVSREVPAPGAVPSEAPAATPAQAPAGAAIARIQKRGTLLVGMDTGEPAWTGTPPMYFPNDSGEPDGFDAALLKAIAHDLGVTPKIVHAKYSGLEELLLDESGKVDLLVSGYSPTDTAGIRWSEPYLEYGLCLVVPTRSKVRTVADLSGEAVGIFDDDAAAEEVSRLVKGYTELVRLEDGYWDQLLAGRFAGFLYDYPYAVAEIRVWTTQNPSKKGALKIAQYNLTDSTYAVGVRAAETDLLEAVNASIAAWRGSEAYREAVRTYLKNEAPAPEAPQGARVVTVAAGETLSLIAQRELGSVDRWPELWEKNRARFPNPHLIDVGDQVVVQ
jgi:polar amino acid transport system substrate-binding protein